MRSGLAYTLKHYAQTPNQKPLPVHVRLLNIPIQEIPVILPQRDNQQPNLRYYKGKRLTREYYMNIIKNRGSIVRIEQVYRIRSPYRMLKVTDTLDPAHRQIKIHVKTNYNGKIADKYQITEIDGFFP